MARASGVKAYNSFVGGLNTESNELTFPENSSYDENNYELDIRGDREVRLGIDYEAGYQESTYSLSLGQHPTSAFKTHEWHSVNNDSDINFLVVQVRNILHFYDLGADPVSVSEKSFTIDLNIFLVSGQSNPGDTVVQMDHGNGWLFVVSQKINPFYIEYDPDTDSVTATEIGIRIRDTEGVDDGLDPDEEPTTLSDLHNYNLRNQGWISPGNGITNPMDTYKSATGEYPPNSKQWHASKDSSDNFDASGLSKLFTGNTLAPKGHFILDPFNKDRTTVSGVSNIPTETSTTRPTAVAFFAGRAWYFHKGVLYFSQIIESERNVGRCYQEGDPTGEEFNEIIATDGGTIPIPEAASGVKLFVTGDSLLLFDSNGLWEVSGSVGQGFLPTDFSINKVGTVGCLSAEAVVDVEGIPIWWADRGIFTVRRSETTDRLIAVSLSEETIQTFYEQTIPDRSKRYAKGSFDPTTRKIRWLFKSDGVQSNNLFEFDRVLNLDVTIGSFYPWTFGELASNSPIVCGIFNSYDLDNPEQSVNVTDNDLNLVTDSGLNTITANISVETQTKRQHKYLIAIPGVDSWTYTIGELNNTDYEDWFTADSTGIGVDAYMETGFLLEGDYANWKQQPYVYFYFDRDVNSSCFVQYKWDWASSGDSGKWSTKRQVYRDRPNFHVAVSRQKIRGKGKALQIRFENETGKGHRLLGWSGLYQTTTQP